MVRFLVDCFVLSKYKCFQRSKEGAYSRMDPKMALRHGRPRLNPLCDLDNREYRFGGRRKLDNEFKSL